MIYFSCDEQRRRLLRDLDVAGGAPALNGIDYLEVTNHPLAATPAPLAGQDLRQRVLRAYFVRPLSESSLASRPVAATVTGGASIKGVRVLSAVFAPAVKPRCLEVIVDRRGDFSTYTLTLDDRGPAPSLLDPSLSAIDFSFKVECESDFDCGAGRLPAVPPALAPELDYLAKDYASFRQLLLDRMAVLVPQWRERNPADLGVTLVELLAYVGDHLSYRQDAIGTEAYLGTARQRISVRRHARFLDYPMHDGCNARAWVHIELSPDASPAGEFLPRILPVTLGEEPPPSSSSEAGVARVQFATRLPSPAPVNVPAEQWSALVATQRPQIFEPVEDAMLYPELNRLLFHGWGDRECCLPKGATKATLRGHLPHLRPGDVLVFAEEIGPRTGFAVDADPARRCAVRLTKVTHGFDEIARLSTAEAQPVTSIEWAAADALPFAFTLSAVTDQGGYLENVSVAHGNNVLADHGMTLPAVEPLPPIPDPDPVLAAAVPVACACGGAVDTALTPPRYQPTLLRGPLTQAARVPLVKVVVDGRPMMRCDPAAPATSALQWDFTAVLPAIRLGDAQRTLWKPRSDLLSSDAFAPEFVVETDDAGHVSLRFGDDVNGQRPAPGTTFHARYRVGHGATGNVAADSIRHIRHDPAIAVLQVISSVTNLLPATGGVDPEPVERVRQHAPAAFRVQRRAVTPADYAARAEAHPDVQKALGDLRWTGSWHTVFLTIDRRGGRPVDEAFRRELTTFLESFRVAGHDLEIVTPRTLPLALTLEVHVLANYYRSDVEEALQRVFGRGYLGDGTRAFFHPDNFTFGTPVAVSRIYAAAQAVPGVAHVIVTRLSPLHQSALPVPEGGVLRPDAAEIICLDNDPNFPERGRLTLEMKDGR